MNRLFGAVGLCTDGFVSFLLDKLVELAENSHFFQWQSVKKIVTGDSVKLSEKSFNAIAQKFKISDFSYKIFSTNSEKLIFALETYFSLVLEAFLSHFGQKISFSAKIYHWTEEIADPKFQAIFDAQKSKIAKNIVKITHFASFQNGETAGDLFGKLYANLISAAARKQLGEFYTPAWLAEHLLDAAGFDGSGETRLLDPACGSGTFLLAAVRRMFRAGQSPQQIVSRIAGYDVNPLAVLMTAANLAAAFAAHQKNLPQNFSLPIQCYDSIQNISPFEEQQNLLTFNEQNDSQFNEQNFSPQLSNKIDSKKFDYVVGNPPWLTWDKLPKNYRVKTQPLWRRYGLFNLSGAEARYGGAKKELALLMIASAAEHFLKPHGKLAMVLPQTIFQTQKTGGGFRRFGGDDLPFTLKVLRVDDFSPFRVFPDAAAKTATLILENGKPTVYPVPYFRWSSPTHYEQCQAKPVAADSLDSAWQIISLNKNENENKTQSVSRSLSQHSDYRAILGANTGGANGVYWVEVLSENADGCVTIRNLAKCGNQPLPTVETEIEAALLYPLLRWSGVKRYDAKPSAYLILAQDPQKRVGLPLETMKENYPKTLIYLQRFETMLRQRAAFRKLFADAPFYSMYNISPETLSPIKVVWRRMDTQIRAAVVQSQTQQFAKRNEQTIKSSGQMIEPNALTIKSNAQIIKSNGQIMKSNDPTIFQSNLFTDKPIIPQETCSMIATTSEQEAFYLTAILNSEPIHKLAAAFSVCGGKGFGSPGILQHLPIHKFDSQCEKHQTLAKLGKSASEEISCEKVLNEIDELVENLSEL